jgi:hypothetical protein
MIVRVFRAEIGVTKVAAYREFLEREIFPQLMTLGCRGAELLVSKNGEAAELIVQSRWPSIETIRAFAGEDIGRAVVEPEAQALFSRFDEVVAHFEVALEAQV